MVSWGYFADCNPALTQPFMCKITDGEALWVILEYRFAAGLMGKLFGNPKKSTEDLEIPRVLVSYGINDQLIINGHCLHYFSYCCWSSLCWKELSAGTNYIVFALVQVGTFAAGFVVVPQGFRMILAEIVPAFQGIAQKLVPNSKPALDVPIIFHMHLTLFH